MAFNSVIGGVGSGGATSGTGVYGGVGAGGAGGAGISGIGLARMLGMAGAAISPEDSWQQRLGATAAEMARKEQGRRYLAELLAGKLERDGALQEGEDKGGKKEGESESSGLGELSDLGGLFESDALAPRNYDWSKTFIGPELSRYLDPTRPIEEKDITPHGGTIRW